MTYTSHMCHHTPGNRKGKGVGYETIPSIGLFVLKISIKFDQN